MPTRYASRKHRKHFGANDTSSIHDKPKQSKSSIYDSPSIQKNLEKIKWIEMSSAEQADLHKKYPGEYPPALSRPILEEAYLSFVDFIHKNPHLVAKVSITTLSLIVVALGLRKFWTHIKKEVEKIKTKSSPRKSPSSRRSSHRKSPSSRRSSNSRKSPSHRRSSHRSSTRKSPSHRRSSHRST
jgi:hypothetical protein